MIKENTAKLNKRTLPAEVRLAAKSAQDRQGEDILVLDLRELSAFTDFFVVMNGNSSRQNQSLMEGIEEDLKRKGLRPLGVEGRENAEWILMDYGYFLVHIFSLESRKHYSLEKLWGDAPSARY